VSVDEQYESQVRVSIDRGLSGRKRCDVQASTVESGVSWFRKTNGFVMVGLAIQGWSRCSDGKIKKSCIEGVSVNQVRSLVRRGWFGADICRWGYRTGRGGECGAVRCGGVVEKILEVGAVQG